MLFLLLYRIKEEFSVTGVTITATYLKKDFLMTTGCNLAENHKFEKWGLLGSNPWEEYWIKIPLKNIILCDKLKNKPGRS